MAAATCVVLSAEPDTIVLPSGEKATERIQLLCAFSLVALSLQSACGSDDKRVRSQGDAPRKVVSRHSPASHTLIVWSNEPDTIVLPSGEKATEDTMLLCAFSLVALRSRVPAKAMPNASDHEEMRQGKSFRGTPASHTLIVLSIGARHDRLAVGREGHGGDSIAVRVLLGRLEVQSTCGSDANTRQITRRCARESRFAPLTCVPHFDRLVRRDQTTRLCCRP